MKKKVYFTRAVLFGPIIACLLLASPTFAANRFGDVFHSVQIMDELGEKVTDISSVSIYLADTTTDAVIYSDRNRQNTITLPMTTGSTNTTLSNGYIEWWGADGYDFSVTDGTNIHTNSGHRTRTSSEGRLVFPSYLQSISTTTYTDAQSATFGTGSDWVAQGGASADRMTWIPATADTAEFWIGSTNFPANLELYGATSGYDLRWDASQDRLEFDDDATLVIGTGADLTIVHSAGTTTIAGAYSVTGIPTFTTDVVFNGATDIKYDDSRAQLHFQDSSVLGIGGAADAVGDVTMTHDGSDFYLDAAIADEGFLIGTTTTGFDIAYRFETAGEFRTDYDAYFINLTDDMDLRFGTGGSADGDFQISSSSAGLLTIGQVVAGTGTVALGVDNAGLDFTFFGDTTTEYLLWDTSADSLIGNLGNVLFTTVDAEANQFKVDATGTVAGFAVVVETTNGGVQINADGAANGDITIDAADILTLTADDHIAIEGAIVAVSRETQIHTVSDTLDAAADVGRLHQVSTDAVVITLPAVATGLKYKIMNVGADGAVEIHVDLNGSDLIIGGCGFTALDDGDKLTNTKASADYGDYVVLEYGNANGWYITEMVGTWADGGA